VNKKTQMIIGIVAIAGIGYLLWKSGQKSQGFANAVGIRGNSTIGKTKACRLVDGGVHLPLPFRLGSGEYIISSSYTGGLSGNGQTLICPDIPQERIVL
jgi:hypothetical protein